MKFTDTMGIAVPEANWVPSPTYILRRAAILDWLRGKPPGKLLEFGCGPGALLRDLWHLGYRGLGVEASETSVRISKDILLECPGVAVVDALPDFPMESVDYVMAFEVLEHLEDDLAGLISWIGYLKPGGVVVISVPAHTDRWNVTDVNAGHFRRYDRHHLLSLLRNAGLVVERVGTYGWPVSRLIEHVREVAVARRLRREEIEPDSIERGDLVRTKASGSDRALETRLYPYYSGFIGKALFRCAIWFQRFFYRTSLGISFIVMARKPADRPTRTSPDRDSSREQR